jgi:dienelactone hydrolase
VQFNGCSDVRTKSAISLALAAVALVAGPSRGRALETATVTIASPLASKGPFTGHLLRPPGAGPHPAIVAMHGCGGLLDGRGGLKQHEADWAQRFLAQGYVALFVDSFTARGLREICANTARSIYPKDRADDAVAAAEWLASQSFVDKQRIGLIGWSHGGMAALWSVRPNFPATPQPFKVAIAFYPGCRQIDRLPDWKPSIPLTVLIGSADDWTRPAPCRRLAERTGFTYIEYPGAYHGFDAADARSRIRRDARAAAIKKVTATLKAALQAK